MREVVDETAWGSVYTGSDPHGRVEAVLESELIRCRYGWRKPGRHEEGFITEFSVKGAGDGGAGTGGTGGVRTGVSSGENQVNEGDGRIDAAAWRGVLQYARVIEDSPRAKTVELCWEPLRGEPAVQRVSLVRDLPAVRIEYLSWYVNIVDIAAPGGSADGGVYCIYGQDDWKRGHVLYPEVYYDRHPGDVGHQNITEVDDPGPLVYEGHLIMGVYNPESGRGFGRCMPVDAIDILKLLHRRGFELFPCFQREHRPFTGYVFAVTGGADEILSVGKRLARLGSS